jgi:hypothetical protein
MKINTETWVEESPHLYDLGRDIANAYKNQLRKDDAVASGDLVNFKWDIVNTPDSLKLQFTLPFYWKYIENGRGPTIRSGNGSLRKSITEWIQDKGIVVPPKMTIEQLSFLISRKIHREGYEGRECLKKAKIKSKPLIEDFVNTIVKLYNNDIYKEINL